MRSRGVRLLAATTLALPVLAGLAGCGADQAGSGPGTSASAPSSGTSSGTASATPSGGTAPTVTAASVLATPIRVAATARGAVAYRSVGQGPALLLVMGFGATQDNWTPELIARLARDHRVITFDNAGVGRTAPLPAPLTVTAMARQAAALVRSLDLPRVDVLGWSMGGMVAQALAVVEPDLVSHLVLAGTLPGDGSATPPSTVAVDRLGTSTTSPVAALALLFPASAAPEAVTYVRAILSWPGQYHVSRAVALAQGAAVAAWVGGRDPAGRRIGTISAPTLVADGTEDRLVPRANTAALVRALPDARASLYPGAGHAFLVQDGERFAGELDAFVG